MNGDINVDGLLKELNTNIFYNLVLTVLSITGLVVSIFLLRRLHLECRTDLFVLIAINISFVVFTINELRERFSLYNRLRNMLREWEKATGEEKETRFMEISGFIRIYFFKKFGKYLIRRDYVDML